jgi:Fur family ferric uptake transcriptional regulator
VARRCDDYESEAFRERRCTVVVMRTSSAPESGATHTRKTLQRDAIARVLRASERFRTAQEIHVQMRLDGETVGLTTVYRHLQIFVDEGVVHTVQLEDRQTAYRWCGTVQHHHHLVCRGCGASRQLLDGEFEARVAKATEGQGFTELSHTFEVFGVCPSCQRQGGTNQ